MHQRHVSRASPSIQRSGIRPTIEIDNAAADLDRLMDQADRNPRFDAARISNARHRLRDGYFYR
jgi:hypothetical protein